MPLRLNAIGLLVWVWGASCGSAQSLPSGTYAGAVRQSLRQRAPLEAATAELRSVPERWLLVKDMASNRASVTRERAGQTLCVLTAEARADDSAYDLLPDQFCDVLDRTLVLKFGTLQPRDEGARIDPVLVWTWAAPSGAAGSLAESGGLVLERP